MTTQPSLFISHGSPMLALEENPAHHFLKNLTADMVRPRAIVSVTAHWLSEGVLVSGDPTPETVYDFGRFDDRLFEMIYPAPGDPDLATDITERIYRAGHLVKRVAKRGFDHGTWVPLTLLYPAADIPVVEISVNPHGTARDHFDLGRALADLRHDNVLILGSGALTHNLRAFFTGHHETVPDWVQEFADWMRAGVRDCKWDNLVDFVEKAPYARENHPTLEHILPLFVALGAAGDDAVGQVLHESIDEAVLAMDAYCFS